MTADSSKTAALPERDNARVASADQGGGTALNIFTVFTAFACFPAPEAPVRELR